MIYFLLSIACWTIWSILGKLTSGRLSMVDSTFYYCVGQALVAILLAFCYSAPLAPMKWQTVGPALAYGIVGAIGIFAFTGALQWRPASFVLPVVSVAYQALALLIFVFMMGESLTMKQVIGLGLMVVATGLLI